MYLLRVACASCLDPYASRRLLFEFEAVVRSVSKELKPQMLPAAWRGYRKNTANQPCLASFPRCKSGGLGGNVGLTLNMSHLDPQLCGGTPSDYTQAHFPQIPGKAVDPHICYSSAILNQTVDFMQRGAHRHDRLIFKLHCSRYENQRNSIVCGML